jgi:hypothetical protein
MTNLFCPETAIRQQNHPVNSQSFWRFIPINKGKTSS